jgi:hypothetical protein
MAAYEIDPTSWVPNGQQVLDGGPAHLPRTFYTPSETPPRRHDSFYIAYVEPQQQSTNHQLLGQVRDFLENQLRIGVEDFQPFLFGIGLLQVRSAMARFALVNHEPFEFQPDVFVRFTNHEEGEYHRGEQGFRIGWLMLLGVPLDYRNDFDISNAIGTFGKFHDWHRDDPLLAHTLVHASFPSPQLVPRHIVFVDYAPFGGVRHGWMACCFILSANFADIMHADEDPMPLDGNPHPLPGNLLIDHHNLVLPQYPELGWNEVPQDLVPDNVVRHLPQIEEEQEIVPHDEVMNHSSAFVQSSLDSVSSDGSKVEQQLIHIQDEENTERAIVPYITMQSLWAQQTPTASSNQVSSVVFGPPLPPAMAFMRLLEPLMLELLGKQVPLSLQVPVVNTFALSKRSWSIAFDQFAGCQITWLGEENVHPVRVQVRRKVARSLQFDHDQGSDTPTHTSASDDSSGSAPVFSASPISAKVKKTRRKKAETPMVDTMVRRCTRSSVKNDGYHPLPTNDVATQPRKRARKQAKAPAKESIAGKVKVKRGEAVSDTSSDDRSDEIASETPIHLLQKVGEQLDIDPAKITAEKLMAPRSNAQKPNSANV